jgi:hypothetical protein
VRRESVKVLSVIEDVARKILSGEKDAVICLKNSGNFFVRDDVSCARHSIVLLCLVIIG